MVQKLKTEPTTKTTTVTTKAFTITLVRHGQTEENAHSIIQGQMNTKLNDAGLRQAQLLASTFPIGDFSLIYSSDLDRAFETCLQLVTRSPFSNGHQSSALIRTDTRLRARNFGALEGKPVDALLFEALGGGAGKTVTEFTPEGGESALEVQERVIEFLEHRLMPEVVADGQKKKSTVINVLVVTHAVVISEMLAYFESFGHASFHHQKRTDQTMRTPNTSVNQLRVHYEGEEAFVKPRIVAAECYQSHGTGHLGEEK